MSELMAIADFAIGGGGVVALERAFWGLPSIAISTAINQNETLRDMASRGLVSLIETIDDVPAMVLKMINDCPRTVPICVDNGTSLVADRLLSTGKK